MPLKESYVIWNNKGGVGKTTLTFHIATQYARRNPTKTVLVIDLCPQANVSMALLSTRDRHGSTHLHELHRQRKTVSFFLQRTVVPGLMIEASDFLTRVQGYNDQVPPNLLLLCGDMYLELVGRHLQHQRDGPDTTNYRPWFSVTSSIRSFIEGLPNIIRGVTELYDEVVVFIDTNPAFSVYTEIALAGARKLLIPINADDFSVEAVRCMLDLVYGIYQHEEPADFKAYREYMFNSKADKYNLRRPKIHLLINNRTTQYNTRLAKAFKAIAEANLKVLHQVYDNHQREKQCFVQHEGQPITNKEAFERQYFVDIQDFHTTAVQCLHIGCPLGAMSGRVEFRETDKTVPVDKQRVTQYLARLDDLVNKL